MKLGRIASLTALVALGSWSLAACSDDTTSTPGGDGGDETGGSQSTGGKGGASGSSGSAGKGNGGTAGSGGGAAGSAGKGTGGAGKGGDGGVVPMDGGDPSIKITDPKDLETISKDAEYTMFPKIPIEFTIANFVLKAPGSTNCPAGACGHVHINVDGNDCNDSGGVYNAAAIASPGIIDLGLCKAGVFGVHTIVASLHNNDHSEVKIGDAGAVISDTITITAKAGDGGTSPDAGDGG